MLIKLAFVNVRSFFKTSESGIVDGLVSFVLNIVHWQSTESLFFSDWVSFESFLVTVLFNVVFYCFNVFVRFFLLPRLCFLRFSLDLFIFSGPSKSVEDLIHFLRPHLLSFVLFSSFMFQDDDMGRAVWKLFFRSVDTFLYSDQSILLFLLHRYRWV